jgi:hypothetical protein
MMFLAFIKCQAGVVSSLVFICFLQVLFGNSIAGVLAAFTKLGIRGALGHILG